MSQPAPGPAASAGWATATCNSAAVRSEAVLDLSVQAVIRVEGPESSARAAEKDEPARLDLDGVRHFVFSGGAEESAILKTLPGYEAQECDVEAFS